MIVESLAGALVPSVKGEAKSSSETEPPPPSAAAAAEPAASTEVFEGAGAMTEVIQAGGGAGGGTMDKDLLCPICMQIIKDAFLTACGHSFCYMCIITHLNNKSDCPCCGHYLTNSQLFPNFLLNKLLKKTSAQQVAKNASPLGHLRQALQQVSLDIIKEDEIWRLVD